MAYLVCYKKQCSFSNLSYLCHKYRELSGKRATKSWRHPLRKPTARAVPTAVKQQAASDDGRILDTHTHTHTCMHTQIIIFMDSFQHSNLFNLLTCYIILVMFQRFLESLLQVESIEICFKSSQKLVLLIGFSGNQGNCHCSRSGFKSP